MKLTKLSLVAALAVSTAMAGGVITSYSIHYTKLYDMRVDDTLLSASNETNGFFYGGNFGFILYASDSMDVDIGYHYYKTTGFDEINKLQGIALSLHYFY